MKKRNEPKFTYKDNYTKCEVIDNKYGRTFIGEAKCNPVDKDFESLITGSTIAEMRARIHALTAYRNDLKIKLEALNQLLYSMNHSKKFNRESYEAKMLFRQIRFVKEDVEMINGYIKDMKKDLKDYIDGKEKVYQILRRKDNK